MERMFDWDRAHDWVLQRYASDRAELTVLFAGSRASLRELAALRRCLPGLRDQSPAVARARTGTEGRYELGELPGSEARRIRDMLKGAGLTVEFRNMSNVSYLPLDRTTGTALIVEDDAEMSLLAQQMIQAGVRVVDIAE
jgi:hypothetical protein